MRKIVKILSLTLALLILVSAFAGCNNGQEGGNVTDTETETESGTDAPQENAVLTVNGASIKDYTVIYSRKANSGGEKAFEYLNQRLEELYGAVLPGDTKEQDGRYEIVIARDGGDGAMAEAYEEHPSGIIGASGKKIIMMGVNYSVLCQLIDIFLAKATGDGAQKSISLTELETPNITSDALKVMSYNVLTDLGKEGRPADARERMIETILENGIDVLGTQEDGAENSEVFLAGMKDYSAYGGAAITGNGNYIYWKTDKFNLIKKGYYFLSDTPTVKSKYEDSTSYRTMAYVILEFKDTGRQFLFVCTHLDYRASEATRIKQINVLASLIKKVNANGLPVVLLGDFNTLWSKSNGAINAFTLGNPEMVMTWKVAEAKGDTGETLVSQEDFVTRYLGAYDYIFVGAERIYTKYYTVVANIKDGKYPSDHLPIVAELELY